jgi:hypothetical protein
MTTATSETSMIARTGCCVFHSETCFANPGCRVWDSKSGTGLEVLVWLGFVTHQFFRFSVMDFLVSAASTSKTSLERFK